MNIPYNTLFLTDSPHAIPVDIGITIKPIPVRLNIIELDVVVLLTILSNDFIIVVNVLFFLTFLFGTVVFIFEICNHFFNIVDMVFIAIYIICFFSNRCSKSLFFNRVDG